MSTYPSLGPDDGVSERLFTSRPTGAPDRLTRLPRTLPELSDSSLDNARVLSFVKSRRLRLIVASTFYCPKRMPSMNDHDKIQRTVLPIPDVPRIGLTTYDAKDPDTKYPPI